MTIVIIGFGSPHGDDQIGWWIVDELSKDKLHNKNIRCIQSNGNGMDWMHQLQDASKVIFVDAVKSGGEPGSLLSISGDDLRSVPFPDNSGSHRYPLNQSIQLAINLGLLTVPYSFYGIEIESVKPFTEVSAMVLDGGIKMVKKFSEEFF